MISDTSSNPVMSSQCTLNSIESNGENVKNMGAKYEGGEVSFNSVEQQQNRGPATDGTSGSQRQNDGPLDSVTVSGILYWSMPL